MKYLDKIDKKAKNISAVNTIVIKNKTLIGYNTDCDGAIQALKEKTDLKGKNIVVLGAGGSSRAIVYGLRQENAKVSILNRTVKKARIIAEDFNCGCGSLNDLKNIDYDILINTTSVGMYPNIHSCITELNMIKNDTIVFDMVFNPYKTKLLQYAEQKNCTIIPGFEMLINGANLQFELWTGKKAPLQLMRKKVLDYLKNASHQN